MSWFAAKTLDLDELCAAVPMEPTEVADPRWESPLCGGIWRDGWYLVIAGRSCSRLVEPQILRSLSASYPVVACSIEEHVMATEAYYWNEGKLTWSVKHQSELDLYHLEALGELPAFYQEIERSHIREQDHEQSHAAEVDFIFEVPLEMAKAVTAFKHDEEPPESFCPRAFHDLRKPWWRFW